MKLEYVKERIDNYFDNISPEELYNTLIKYKMKIPEKVKPFEEDLKKIERTVTKEDLKDLYGVP